MRSVSINGAMRGRRKKSPHTLVGDHAQQPPDVVARRAQNCVDPIADLALQLALIQTVIGLHMPDDRFYGLAPLEQYHPDFAKRLIVASVTDIDLRVVVIDTTIAQIGVGRVLNQDCGLLELLG